MTSAAFIQGRCSNGTTSDLTSTHVSSSSENFSLLLPFQKYVTCPYFWVSEIAYDLTPALTRYSDIVSLIEGGLTKNLDGICKSPSYSSIPAYITSGLTPLSKWSNSSSSKALEISIALSPLKLKRITESWSLIVPTGWSFSSTITNSLKSWSLTPSSSR